jgi:tRNA(fMet)-specific endonuclease VapC
MNGSFLLDTNIVISLLEGEENVVNRVAETESVFVPAIVLGELYFGARKSFRVQENLERVEKFAAGTSILDCDKRTAHEYGRIKNLPRQRGRPLPDNDIWIAAMAFRFGLIVATRDAHFQQIDELETIGW